MVRLEHANAGTSNLKVRPTGTATALDPRDATSCATPFPIVDTSRSAGGNAMYRLTFRW
jgi:hypothetical protein